MQNGHAVKLAQQVLTANLGPILQMPAGYAAIITNIEVVNTSGSSVARLLYDVDEGDSAGSTNAIYTATKSGGDSLSVKVVLGEGNSLYGSAGAEDSITVTCYGLMFKSGN